MTQLELINDKAEKKANKIAAAFNLMEHLGINPEAFDTEEDWPITISGLSASRRQAEITTTLHELSDQIQDYLRETLPNLIAEQMIDDYLNSEIDVPAQEGKTEVVA